MGDGDSPVLSIGFELFISIEWMPVEDILDTPSKTHNAIEKSTILILTLLEFTNLTRLQNMQLSYTIITGRKFYLIVAKVTFSYTIKLNQLINSRTILSGSWMVRVNGYYSSYFTLLSVHHMSHFFLLSSLSFFFTPVTKYPPLFSSFFTRYIWPVCPRKWSDILCRSSRIVSVLFPWFSRLLIFHY